MLVYLDESGDLGWTFTAPYRSGGSSRYITIASLIVHPSKKHLPKRRIQKLYQRYGWNPAVEKKWVDLRPGQRLWFAQKVADMEAANKGDIKLFSITARKQNVQKHIRADENKLYNYMIGLSLLREMARYDEVKLYPDARSIKVGSGNSLHDYLQTQLWFDRGVRTRLITAPCRGRTKPTTGISSDCCSQVGPDRP